MTQTDVLYDVYFTGKLLDGTTAQQAAQTVSSLFKTTPDKIAYLFNGNTHILKKKLSKQDALKYKSVLRKAGLSILFKVHDDKVSTNNSPSTSSTAANNKQQVTASDPQNAQTQTSVPPTGALSLAPPGSDVLSHTERKGFVPVDIDTSQIHLTSPFLEPETITQTPPPPPSTSHIHIAELGADLSTPTPAPQPLDLNLNEITLAPPGSQLETLSDDTPELNPDISEISIAPAGADLIAEKKTPAPAAAVDTSHISLED